MDSEKETAEEQLEELKESLKNWSLPSPQQDASVTINSGYESANWSNTVIGGGYTYSIGNLGGITNGITAGTGLNNSFSWGNPVTVNQSGKVYLDGDEADMIVNGKSMMETLTRIEERLGIIDCKEDLEAEWDQLKELGDQYRACEAKIKQKIKMWERLKKKQTPPREEW